MFILRHCVNYYIKLTLEIANGRRKFPNILRKLMLLEFWTVFPFSIQTRNTLSEDRTCFRPQVAL